MTEIFYSKMKQINWRLDIELDESFLNEFYYLKLKKYFPEAQFYLNNLYLPINDQLLHPLGVQILYSFLLIQN